MNDRPTDQVGDPAPFGFVCKSKTQTNFPWLNTKSWSDGPNSIGNMRRHIGDAQVWKTRGGAESYTACDVVPIYSDPRKTGERALLPYVEVTIISIWSKAPEIGRYENVTYSVRVKPMISINTMLEEAFSITNHDDRPMGNRACSTTAGDIMVINGDHYLVQGAGFLKLSVEDSEKVQKLTSRDTSFGYAFLKSRNLI